MAVANKVVTTHTNVGIQDPDRDAVLQKWYYNTLETICLFLSHGVTPIYIFDGTHLPEKAGTQEKRKQSKVKAKEEIESLKCQLRGASPLDQDPKLIQRLKQLLSNTTYIKKEEFSQLENLLMGIGVPVLQAKGDAEQLCAALAREGLISAVYSEDTDNLVYGCPLMITGMGESYRVGEEDRSYRKVICVLLEDILEDLQWSHETFIEFCITLGCDFNERIRGIGPARAYQLIQEYGSIDKYPEKFDTTCLDYTRCREIFQHNKPVQIIEGDELPISSETLYFDRDLFFREGEETLTQYSSGHYYRRLWHLVSSLPSEPIGKLPKFPKRKIIKVRKTPVE
jgi:5'-3' exonuclease